MAVKLVHTCKVVFYSKAVEGIQFISPEKPRSLQFIPTSYSVDITCNLFNYRKCILILTPQFFEVLHPFQYIVSNTLSTWMHTQKEKKHPFYGNTCISFYLSKTLYCIFCIGMQVEIKLCVYGTKSNTINLILINLLFAKEQYKENSNCQILT